MVCVYRERDCEAHYLHGNVLRKFKLTKQIGIIRHISDFHSVDSNPETQLLVLVTDPVEILGRQRRRMVLNGIRRLVRFQSYPSEHANSKDQFPSLQLYTFGTLLLFLHITSSHLLHLDS